MLQNLDLGKIKHFLSHTTLFSDLRHIDDQIYESESILKTSLPVLAIITFVLLLSVILTGQNQYTTLVLISLSLLFVEYILATRGYVIIASYAVSLTPAVMISYSYANYIDFNDEISLFFAFWLAIFFSALFLPRIHYLISLIITFVIIIFTLQVIEGFTIAHYIENFDLIFSFVLVVMFATALFFGRHLMANLLLIEIDKKNKANIALIEKSKSIEKARSEAETASKNKSMFLASVSHELRTPLNGIINFSGFVKSGKFGDVAPQHTHMLERIHDSGYELLKLINNVLDSSKIASDSFVLFYEDDVIIDDLFDGFDQVQNFKFNNSLGQAIADADISFALRGIDEAYPLLNLDADRIRQALFEVLMLCFYYTTSGSVCVDVSQSASNRLSIRIEDSSGDILNSITPDLFDLKNLTTGEIVFHIGLGLSIAKEIIELHGGTIDYLHGPKGNIFQIELPVFKERLS
ncbi:MAG: histidine kinase dimerization/phospho-acceptor domain-containing protein [Phototrophicaceae bacterium]